MNPKSYLSNLRYAFKVYDYRTFIFLAAIWIVLFTIPNGFIPDYFNLENMINSGGFVSFIRIVIPFVGFIIGFLTLALGILRERFKRQALNELISNFYLSHILTISIGLIFILILTHFQINYENPNHTDLNIAYFSSMLSSIYLILLFPLLILSIVSIDSNHTIKRLVENIKPTHFKKRTSLLMGVDESNPILVLKNLLSYSIDRYDESTIHFIMYGTSEKILEMINHDTPRETIDNYFDGLLLICEELVERSIRGNTPSHISDVYYLFEIFNKEFVNKRIPLLFLSKMIYFIQDTSEKISVIKNRDLLRTYLQSMENVLEFHFNNAPHEKDIPKMQYANKEEFLAKYGDLHGNRKPQLLGLNYNLEWQQISGSIPYIYSATLARIIETNNYSFFEETISSINSLIPLVVKSSLGSIQKERLIQNFTSIIFSANQNAIKNNLINTPEKVKSLSAFSLNDIIDQQEDYIRVVISSYFEFAFYLMNTKMLSFNHHIDDVIGTIGIHCANAYDHNKTAKRTLDFLLKGIEKLKSELETDLVNNTNNYLYLKTNLEDFEKWHLKDLWKHSDWAQPEKTNPHPNKELIKKIKKAHKSFKEVKTTGPNEYILLSHNEY